MPTAWPSSHAPSPWASGGDDVAAVSAAPSGRAGDLRNYALVTGAYWADTIADGAIRVLVLFYFH